MSHSGQVREKGRLRKITDPESTMPAMTIQKPSNIIKQPHMKDMPRVNTSSD